MVREDCKLKKKSLVLWRSAKFIHPVNIHQELIMWIDTFLDTKDIIVNKTKFQNLKNKQPPDQNIQVPIFRELLS